MTRQTPTRRVGKRTYARVAGWLALVAALVALLGSARAGAGTQSKRTGRPTCPERYVEIQASGYKIPGIFTTPRGGGARAHYPAVLLLHGGGGEKNGPGYMFQHLDQKLGALGYASLRIDFAGSGDSTLPQTAFTFGEEVADAKTALTWLSANRHVNANALGLVGYSEGGRVAATVAGTDPRVKALTTWAPWVEDGSTAVNIFGADAYQQAQQNGQVTIDFGFGNTWTFSLAWFETIKNSHPLQDIAHYRAPLLGVVGSEDGSLPQTNDEISAAGSSDKTLHVVAGADHFFHVFDADQTQAEEAMNTTAAWFSRKLAPAKCVVPNVLGKPLAKARTRIARAHCRVGTVTRVASAKKKNTVIGESPRAGKRLKKGARVRLKVSRGR